MYFILRFILLFLRYYLYYIEAKSRYSIIHIYLSTLSQNNKVHPSFRSLCSSFFGFCPSSLRPHGDLLAQSMIPRNLYYAPVNYPGVVIRRRAAGGVPSEILTLAEGRSRGVHGLSLVRGIRLIALTQLIP